MQGHILIMNVKTNEFPVSYSYCENFVQIVIVHIVLWPYWMCLWALSTHQGQEALNTQSSTICSSTLLVNHAPQPCSSTMLLNDVPQ